MEESKLVPDAASAETGGAVSLRVSKKALVLAGLALVLLAAAGITGAVYLANRKDGSGTADAGSSGSFNFNQCLKDHTKPGDDTHVANDACIKLREAQERAASPSPSGTGTAALDDGFGGSLGDPYSSDPLERGRSLGNGQCSGIGSTDLTHAPMDMKDVETIQPMGLMIGAHVTPVDHEYYYQKDFNAPKDTYPVYATMDGTIVAAGHVGNAWSIVISHSCTFYQQYNLMTSLAADVQAKLPAGWGPNNNGGVKIPVTSGQVVGYVGGQSLDFCVWDTQNTLAGFLHPTAYNNAEPWKLNTVAPLYYFTDAVKAEVLTRYVRTAEPRDGTIDYDVKGEAIGNWFRSGTNGYAGSTTSQGGANYWAGHLALAPDYIGGSQPVFSIGSYNGGDAAQFAVKGNVDYARITPASGPVKLELGELQWLTGSGQTWVGAFAAGIHAVAGPTKATALIQLTADEEMKVEVFPGKVPAQVDGFTAAAVTYTRGQDAVKVGSGTATR